MCSFWSFFRQSQSRSIYCTIFGHTWDKNILSRQFDVSTWVSNWKRRSLRISRKTRWSIAGQPLTCRIQNPDTSQADRGGAAHGGAAGRCGVGRNADGSVRQENNRPCCLPLWGIEDNCPERLFESTNKRNYMKTYGWKKPAVDNRFITGMAAG